MIRKKTLNLDQRQLDRVRLLLRARTETETLTRCMEIVERQHRQIAGLHALARLGPFDRTRIED